MDDTLGSDASVYVHVPFCKVKCGYCDFNSYTVERQEVLDRFLDALDRELTIAQLPERPVSVFIGGGTPTFFDIERFGRLLEVLCEHVDLEACPEVTMEANPESVTAEKGSIARAAGVNRMSMGAQSFRENHLRFLDRAHSAEQTRGAVRALREAGCDNLSLDLIHSIPSQRLEEWQSDLESVLELRPDHLSCYSLTFEPGTRLHRDLQNGKEQQIDELLDRDMFLHTRERLTEAGFDAYEISNFAGDGGPCLHNDHYWLQGNYAGVGPGASSHRDGVRSTNLKPLHSWADCVERGVSPVAQAETLSPTQRAGEAIWLGVRRQDGVDLVRVGERLDLSVLELFADTVAGLCEQELVAWDGRRVRLTAKGLLFANTVGESFLCAPGSDSQGQTVRQDLG